MTAENRRFFFDFRDAGPDLAGPDLNGSDPARHATSGQDTSGQATSGQVTSGQDPAGQPNGKKPALPALPALLDRSRLIASGWTLSGLALVACAPELKTEGTQITLNEGVLSADTNTGLVIIPSDADTNLAELEWSVQVTGAANKDKITVFLKDADANNPAKGKQLWIKAGSEVDYDQQSGILFPGEVSLVVHAFDGQETGSLFVYLSFTDLNDEAPVFTSAGDHALTLTNNRPHDLIWYQAAATDKDTNEAFNTITFSLKAAGGTHSADAALFQIDAETGQVTLARGARLPDGQSVFKFIVTATDKANPVDQEVTITVTVAGDRKPTGAELSRISHSIDENTNIDTDLTLATVTSIRDDGRGTVTLALEPGSPDIFKLANLNGTWTLQLKAGTQLDFESRSSYQINLVLSGTQDSDFNDSDVLIPFTLTIKDVDEAPVWAAASYAFTMENKTANAVLAKTGTAALKATDPDANSGAVTYSLGGADASDFNVAKDSNGNAVLTYTGTGENYGATPDIKLIATSDNKTAEAAITITITDVNNAPVVSLASQTVTSLLASHTATTNILTVTVTDADPEDTHTLAIAGPDAGWFRIDQSTGQVTFTTSTRPPKAGKNAFYNFTVTATDDHNTHAGNNSAGQNATGYSALFTIRVNNEPEISGMIPDLSAVIGQSGWSFDLNHYIQVEDLDLDSLDWSVRDSSDTVISWLDITDGVLSFADNQTLTAGSYNLTLRVTDTGNAYDETDFSLTLGKTISSDSQSAVTLTGTPQGDIISTSKHAAHIINAGAGDDYITPKGRWLPGSTLIQIDGGAGFDILDFSNGWNHPNAGFGVWVQLLSSTRLPLSGGYYQVGNSNKATDNPFVDSGTVRVIAKIKNIEGIVGSEKTHDVLIGDANDNFFRPMGATLPMPGSSGGFLAGKADWVDGNGGNDTVSFSELTSGHVELDLDIGQLGNGNFPDQMGGLYSGSTRFGRVTGGKDSYQNIYLIRIENVIGSAGADSLTGDDGNNIIEGGAGADTIRGEGGTDTASYASSATGVEVTVNATSGNIGGDAAGDKLFNIENLIGSAFQDILTGDSNANKIEGGAGHDVIDGGGGADILDGGAGQDTISFADRNSGITITVADGKFNTDGTNTNGEWYRFETSVQGSYTYFRNFEIFYLTDYRDTVTGSSGDDRIFARDGDDTITGGAGQDILDGGRGSDRLTGGAGAGRFVLPTFAVSDKIASAEMDIVTDFNAAEGDRILVWVPANDTVISSQSELEDELFGENTTLEFVKSGTADVDIKVSNYVMMRIEDGWDTTNNKSKISYADLELRAARIIGDDTDNRITGTDFAERIEGRAGNDVIDGGGSADDMLGGAGIDTASFASSRYGVRADLSTTDQTHQMVFTDASIDAIRLGPLTVDGESVPGYRVFETLNSSRYILAILDLPDSETDRLAGKFKSGEIVAALGPEYSGGNINFAEKIIVNLGEIETATADDISWHYKLPGLTYEKGPVVTVSGLNIGDPVRDVQTWRFSLAKDAILSGAHGDKLTGFENLTGSSGHDVLLGDDGVNILSGGQGFDILYGRGGDDILIAGSGIRFANGDSSQQDILHGGAGNDLLIAGSLNNTTAGDRHFGGSGFDIVSYAGLEEIYGASRAGLNTVSFSGVFENRTTNAFDQYHSIEGIIGTAWADRFVFAEKPASNTEFDGRMLIEGGAGRDSFLLQATDLKLVLSYASSAAAVQIDLSSGSNGSFTGGDAAGDSVTTGLAQIRGLIGSDHADTLTGRDTVIEAFWGRGGQDVLTGGTGADLFVLTDPATSLASADVISDFTADDQLVLHLDLNPGGANNTKLWVVHQTDSTDLDGDDSTADMITILYGGDGSYDPNIVYAVLAGQHFTAGRVADNAGQIHFHDFDNAADLLANAALDTLL